MFCMYCSKQTNGSVICSDCLDSMISTDKDIWCALFDLEKRVKDLESLNQKKG